MNNLDITSYIGKNDGDTLSATQWNAVFTSIQSKVNELVASNGSSYFYVNGVLTVPTNNIITLAAGSSYVLEGVLYGQVVIDATTQPTANTLVRLNGVQIITNATSGIKYKTPESNTGFKDLVVTLSKDSVNSIVCTTVAAIAENQEACLYSMNNLVVQGIGYLTCVNKGGHGIKGSELRITGPHIYVEASHDAIHGAAKLFLDCGTFFINKANDAFGTGTTGFIDIFGGTYYAYNITEQVFDGKVNTNIFDRNHTISGTNVATASQYTNIVKVYSSPVTYYGATTAGTINQFTTVTKNADGTWTGTAVAVTPDANGIYQVTAPFAEIKGYINAPINTASTLIDVEFRLDKAYIENTTKSIPTIYYQATDKKIKLYSAQDTVNMIVNTVVGDNTVDIDGVKSENNISVEVKNSSHLIVYSTSADGLDGSDIKVTDTKGVLVCNSCGGRGIKGSCVIIGPNADTTKSVITKYYTDPTDTANYSTMDGGVVCLNNCQKYAVSIGKTDTEDPTTYKDFGYTDVYCRNGKCSKGVFGTQNSCLTGVFICNTIAAVIGLEFDKADNIYYVNMLTPGSTGITNGCGNTHEQYTYIPYSKAPVIK